MADAVHQRLGEIEKDLLSSSPLADCLRKCIALGADLRSAPLREWAQRELSGYPHGTDPPAYRKVRVTLVGDIHDDGAAAKRTPITNVPDSVRETPEFMDCHYDLRAGVAEVEAMASHADTHDSGTVRLPAPFAEEVKSYVSTSLPDQTAHVSDVYWTTDASAMRGVLDQVRTTAVSILTEIRVELDDAGTSREEAANNAVHVHVDGGKRHTITVNTNQSVQGDASITPASDGEAVRWTKRQTYWTVAGVAIAVFALFIGYLQLRG